MPENVLRAGRCGEGALTHTNTKTVHVYKGRKSSMHIHIFIYTVITDKSLVVGSDGQTDIHIICRQTM